METSCKKRNLKQKSSNNKMKLKGKETVNQATRVIKETEQQFHQGSI